MKVREPMFCIVQQHYMHFQGTNELQVSASGHQPETSNGQVMHESQRNYVLYGTTLYALPTINGFEPNDNVGLLVVLCCVVLYYIVLYCTVLYCTVFFQLHGCNKCEPSLHALGCY